MNKIEFENMTDCKKRNLYECMWDSEAFDFPVKKTEFKKSESNNSYTFSNASSTDMDKCANRLIELFGIKKHSLFKEKFAQSCNGSGKELKRIATIHSSSLCALLFFYNVSKDNPYVIENEGKEYIFTYSCFEYQNTVLNGRNPSNIDVVLIGKNKQSGEDVVLFLESKFSEYYNNVGRKLKIATAYLDDKSYPNDNYGKVIYNEASLAEMSLEMTELKDGKNFILSSKEACYLEGIKQMISHYIGIRNLCDSPKNKEDNVARAVSKGAKLLLGEILFTKGIGKLHIKKGIECFASYKEKYRILANILNEQLKKDGMSDKITVLSDVLSYDKRNIQEPLIKRFYFESGK